MSLHQGGSGLRGETLKSSFGDAAFSQPLAKASVVRWPQVAAADPLRQNQFRHHCVASNATGLDSVDSLNDGPAPDRWNES
jgi:hypothetical protein